MTTGSKAFSLLLRLCQFCSSGIVVGLLGRFFYLLHTSPGSPTNGRLVYAEVVASLALVVSILLVLPLGYSFRAWPVDAVFFALWVVAFGLLVNVSMGIGRWKRVDLF